MILEAILAIVETLGDLVAFALIIVAVIAGFVVPVAFIISALLG
jgi:hypothetical protein